MIEKNLPDTPQIDLLPVPFVKQHLRSDVADASGERMQLLFRRIKMFGSIERLMVSSGKRREVGDLHPEICDNDVGILC